MASTLKHIRLFNWIMDTAAWSSLTFGARCLLLEVWRRHNGQNNGQISYSQREAVKALGCSAGSASRWFGELQEKGFLVAVKRSSFDWKEGAREARATVWRLTMEPYNGERPTKEFASWNQSEKKSTDTLVDAHGYSGGDLEPPKPEKKPKCIHQSIRQPTKTPSPRIRESITYSIPGRGGRDWLHLGAVEEANHAD